MVVGGRHWSEAYPDDLLDNPHSEARTLATCRRLIEMASRHHPRELMSVELYSSGQTLSTYPIRLELPHHSEPEVGDAGRFDHAHLLERDPDSAASSKTRSPSPRNAGTR